MAYQESRKRVFVKNLQKGGILFLLGSSLWLGGCCYPLPYQPPYITADRGEEEKEQLIQKEDPLVSYTTTNQKLTFGLRQSPVLDRS